MVDQPGEHVGEVGLGLDSVQLTGFHQQGQHRPVLASGVGAGEEGFLPVQGHGTGCFGATLDAHHHAIDLPLDPA